MAAIIADHRRMRRHTLTLPPDFSVVEPLDVISWTSEANGYSAKSFELGEVRREILTGNVLVTLREVDPEDYDPPVGLVRPAPPDTTPARPALQTLPGWGVTASALVDAGSTARRPAITASWTAAGVDDARGIRIAIRLDGDSSDGRELPLQDAAAGSVILADGILPATDYQLRALPVLDRETDWTGWTPVTTLDVRTSLADLQADLASHLTELGDWIGAGIDLPTDLGGQAATLRAYLDQMRALTAEGAESAARSMIAEMQVRDYIGSAEIRLGTRISVSDEQVAIIAAAITTLQAQIPGLASVTAFNALVATVTQQGGNITAIGDSLTALSATVGQFSASGLLRVTVEATPSGALSRIGLKAAATGAEAQSLREAALYLEAIAGDKSRIILNADRVAISTGVGDAVVFPFMVIDGVVYIDQLRLGSGVVDGDMIVGGAVSRTGFIMRPTDLSITSTTPVQVGSTVDVDFVAYEGDPFYPDNPVMVEVSATISTSGAASACYFGIEARDTPSDPWVNVGTVALAAISSPVALTGRALLTTPWSGFPISGPQQVRLVAYRPNSGAPNFTIGRVLCTLEQLNK